MLVAAELWAAEGTAALIDEHVRKEKPFTPEEVKALLRAAYGAGYVDALSGPSTSILAACQMSEALRLTLPLS